MISHGNLWAMIRAQAIIKQAEDDHLKVCPVRVITSIEA